jgi:hypothetical protein
MRACEEGPRGRLPTLDDASPRALHPALPFPKAQQSQTTRVSETERRAP